MERGDGESACSPGGRVMELDGNGPAASTSTRMRRAFLFDLDGTLIDSERENAAAIDAVLAARGRPLTDEDKAFVVGHGWREIHEHLAAPGGVDLSLAELMEAAADEKERLIARGGLLVLPGSVGFVRRAATFGRCSVVSGSSRREIAWALRFLGLDDIVRWFVGAEDVTAGKPSPEGYLAAARRLDVDPSACWVFEDSSAGIAAARAAGMRCVALAAGNFLGQDQSSADLCVETFEALGDRLWE